MLERVRSIPEIQVALIDVWTNIKAEAGIRKPIRIAFPGGQVDDDVYVISRLNSAFYFWPGGSQSSNGIWVISDLGDRTLVTADFEYNLPKNEAAWGNRLFGRMLKDESGYISAHVGRLGGGRNTVKAQQFRLLAAQLGHYPVDVDNESLFIVSRVAERRMADDFADYAILWRRIGSAKSAGTKFV